MKRSQRRFWFGAIAALILMVLIFAPHASTLQQGSTYSRAPSGYGAWYAEVQSRGISIQRWQRPLEDLSQSSQTAAPMTLLRVSNGLEALSISNENWLKQGNVLVLLGIRTPVTAAPFRSILNRPVGGVKIETRRRYSLSSSLGKPSSSAQPSSDSRPKVLLSDRFGAVVWEQSLGKGRVIFATAPHLAANAYQDEPGNFAFLTQLLTDTGNPIWVDEYLHGYKDAAAIAKETSQSLIHYLAQTPLLLVAVQAGVLLVVLVWGQNQRLGPPRSLATPVTDNSEAYIQALAGVLHKANCSEFVVEVVGKAEQLQVQRSLGLGTDLLEPDPVIAVWTQQTKEPPDALKQILSLSARPHRLSEAEFREWLDQIQRVHRHLPEL